MTARVLVAGFGPYAHTPVNPAEAVARALDGAEIDGPTMVGRVVPCTFFGSIDFVQAAIAEVQPSLVVMWASTVGGA